MSIIRFGVSLKKELLENFDRLIEKKGFSNRSEAIRDLIRDTLVGQEIEANKEVVGTLTLVYNHHASHLSDQLTDIQHDHFKEIVSTLHIHLDAHNCLEVLVLKGKAKEVKKIGEALIGTKGVKHGKLTITTTGKEIV